MTGTDWEAVEVAIKATLEGEFSSAHLTFNNHRSYYLTAQAACDEDEHGMRADDWVSPEERAFAIENESVWTFQWYPNTPVGFCILSAGRLGALMHAVAKDAS